MRASLKSAEPAKSVHHKVDHEVGPRWYELVSVTPCADTGFDVYVLKQMHTTRTRYYHDDKTKSLSEPVDCEVEGVRRTVEVTAQSTTHRLRDGSRFIRNVLIRHMDSPSSFSGQITFHIGRRISLTGYHGSSI